MDFLEFMYCLYIDPDHVRTFGPAPLCVFALCYAIRSLFHLDILSLHIEFSSLDMFCFVSRASPTFATFRFRPFFFLSIYSHVHILQNALESHMHSCFRLRSPQCSCPHFHDTHNISIRRVCNHALHISVWRGVTERTSCTYN
jgi:hypothetical protein